MATASVERTAPAPAYLAMMATGLRESRGWDEDRIASYLAALSPQPPRN